MKARRLISVGLSAALLMGLTACTDEEPAVGSNEPSATQAVPATTSGVPSTMKEDDKEAMAGIEVKDAKKLENPTVKWLSFWDINPVNGKAVPVHLEMFENVYGGKIGRITRNDDTAKEISKKQLFEDYKWSEEMYNCLETVQNLTEKHPVIDLYAGVSAQCNELLNNPVKDSFNNGASWTQTRESIIPAVQAELDTVNARLNS